MKQVIRIFTINNVVNSHLESNWIYHWQPGHAIKCHDHRLIQLDNTYIYIQGLHYLSATYTPLFHRKLHVQYCHFSTLKFDDTFCSVLTMFTHLPSSICNQSCKVMLYLQETFSKTSHHCLRNSIKPTNTAYIFNKMVITDLKLIILCLYTQYIVN